MKRILFSAAAGVLALASQASASVPQDRFAALQWRSIGPFRGGRVLAVAGVAGQPEHFYFGAVNGGVWETQNAGRTWRPIADALPNGSIGALAVAPSAPNVIYVGTGEADMRSDIAQGVGLFRSTDGGRTWSFSGLKDTQSIARILVDPRSPEVVLVAALGHPYGPNPDRGVFRSGDGGKSWARVLFKDVNTGAVDLAFEPGNPDVVYASLWGTRRPPWNVYPPSTGPAGGLYKSVDGGRTWRELKGLPAHPGRIGVGISAAAPKRVYALVDAPKSGGLYRSDDGGDTWTKTSGDARIWERGWYFGGLTIDPKYPDRVFVCDVSVYQSDDGGRTFVPVKGAPGGDDYHAMWIDPAAPERRILGVDQGAVVTVDGGRTWSSWYNQPTGQFYHVAVDNRFPYFVYGPQQDSGAAGVPSRTGSLDGVNITQFRETTAGGESDNIAPDPEDPDILFGGRVDRLDLKTGQTRSLDPTLAVPGQYRGTWTLPLVFSPRDSRALYFANQRVFRTRDGGEHWDPVSPDLTRENPAVPKTLDPATIEDHPNAGNRRGVVYAIAPSPAKDGLIWAGTDDGLVWKSDDDGAHWSNVTPKGVEAWSKIGVIEASRFDPQTAYIAVDRHRLDDFRPYIYRTHDGGRSWTLVVGGLAARDSPRNSVNVVREDGVRPGLLYAGTERAAWVSFDDGGTWQRLGANLPATSVRDIAVHGDDLAIATHGRGFWIMDDVAALREIAGAPLAHSTLFTPAKAWRARPFGFTGTPFPRDEPMAANPPDGAFIDYWLPEGAGPVSLTIVDAAGRVVRHASSTDKPGAPDVTKLRLTPDWAVAPSPPAATPGMHRWVWDLHYARAKGAPETDDNGEDAVGVWAPPGHYEVRLEAGGRTETRALVLEPDPRVRAEPASYAAEFDLARSIEGDMARATSVAQEAAALHKRLQAAAFAATGSRRQKLEKAGHEVAFIADIRGDKPQTAGLPDSQAVDGLTPLAGRFARLYRAVDGADGGPSADARDGYAKARAALDHALARWAEVRRDAEAALTSK